MNTETITKPDTTTAAVWLGCLACYNNGVLAGDWLDEDGILDTEGDYSAVDFVEEHKKNHPGHEEFEVFDYENLLSDDAHITLEYAVKAIEWAQDVENRTGIPADVAKQYVDDTYSCDFLDVDPMEIEDRYMGAYESTEDWAYELASECFNLDDIPSFISIDWERTTRDLMMDYHAVETGWGEPVYIFSA